MKKSPVHKGWLELMDQELGRLVAGCMILLSEIPLFYPSEEIQPVRKRKTELR